MLVLRKNVVVSRNAAAVAVASIVALAAAMPVLDTAVGSSVDALTLPPSSAAPVEVHAPPPADLHVPAPVLAPAGAFVPAPQLTVPTTVIVHTAPVPTPQPVVTPHASPARSFNPSSNPEVQSQSSTTAASKAQPADAAVKAQSTDTAAKAQPIDATAKAQPTAYAGQKLGARVPPAIAQWESYILASARKYNLDPNLVAAVMHTESKGDPDAVSPASAIGLMQVVGGPFDPAANVDLGTKMLADNLKMFGTLELALAGYNAGPGNVMRYGGVPPFDETHKHISRTLASYESYRA